MGSFNFHGELFEVRSTAIEALSANRLEWLADYGSVDLAHDIYGLEVTGIGEQGRACLIRGILTKLLPDWRFHRLYYEDQNRGEIGWKLIISRDPEPGVAYPQVRNAPPKPLSEIEKRRQREFYKNRRREMGNALIKLRRTEYLIASLSGELQNPDLPPDRRANTQENLKKLQARQRQEQAELKLAREKRPKGE